MQNNNNMSTISSLTNNEFNNNITSIVTEIRKKKNNLKKEKNKYFKNESKIKKLKDNISTLKNNFKKKTCKNYNIENNFYNVKYINIDKYYKLNIEIMDFILDNNFIYFLQTLQNYLSNKNKNLYNLTKNNCDINCAKKKMLLLFIVDNFVTDSLYDILINILAKKIYESFYNIKSIYINQNTQEKISYNLFYIKDDMITFDFEGINTFIFTELVPIFSKNTGNKAENIKIHYLINLIIMGFNWLYDNHKTFIKISKDPDYLEIAKDKLYYYSLLPKCKNIKNIKNKFKEDIKNNNNYDIKKTILQILPELFTFKNLYLIIQDGKLEC